jgi:hypothetical protein
LFDTFAPYLFASVIDLYYENQCWMTVEFNLQLEIVVDYQIFVYIMDLDYAVVITLFASSFANTQKLILKLEKKRY